MRQICLFLFISATIIASGCSYSSSPPAPQNVVLVIPGLPLLKKHNFRTESQDGWTANVWTDCMVFRSDGVDVGFRLTKEGEANPPKVKAVLRFYPEQGQVERKAQVFPELSDAAIQGGYEELVYGNRQGAILREGTFIGKKGTWETIMKDPLKIAPRKTPLPEGLYFIDVTLSMENGPEFRFQGLEALHKRTYR